MLMLRTFKPSLAAVLLLVGGVVLVIAIQKEIKSMDRAKKTQTGRDRIVVRLLSAPFSTDPLDYDAAVHHVSARPLFASIVTQYKAGTIEGAVVESWTSTPDLKTWRFDIRSGLRFSNGDPITPMAIVRSLTRMAWIQHSRDSKSGLLEDLVGIESLTSASGMFLGISINDNRVVMSFQKPQPKLLENISFGLYGIAHASDFDAKTGSWLNPHSAVSSGAYKLSEWNDDNIQLSLRDDFPVALRHSHAAQQIKMVWGTGKSERLDLDMGNSLAPEGHENDTFYGSGAVDVNLYWIYVWPWNLASSPLHDKNIRTSLRSEFYKHMKAAGLPVVRSFLPTTIAGIAEFVDPAQGKFPLEQPLSLKVSLPRLRGEIFVKIDLAIKSAASSLGGNPIEVPAIDYKNMIPMFNPNLNSYLSDISPRLTGILIEDPIADVRFMIQSREGIRLPDPTGELAKEAAKPDTNLAHINQILWDDAIVWPVTPFIMGLWARKDMFDFSQINLSLPATDLSWIGLKE
jgi:Bacterial extracellular solute-binding proteins, family 5 Middle